MSTETIERIDPAKTALLVMDYQQGILGRQIGRASCRERV